MPDIELNDIRSGYNLSKINDNFEKIEQVINEDIIHTNGDNNVMLQDLDMNSNRILNSPKPTDPTHLVRLQDLGESAIYDGSFIIARDTQQINEDGQLVIVFNEEFNTASLLVEVFSPNADSQTLLPDIDYTTTTSPTNTITLTESYPYGTYVRASQGQLHGEEIEVDAIDVGYDNTGSSLTATNAQEAIDEAYGVVLTNTSNITSVQSEVDLLKADNPTNETGTSYTLVIGDSNKTVWMDNALANTVTIPTNSSVPFPINTLVLIMMEGVGVTTVEADSGVTLNGVSAGSGDLEQYRGVTLVKRGTDEWIATPLEVT